MTRAARLLALVLAAIGFVWAAWLIAGGGGDFDIAGVRLRSHEPLRPFAIGCVALAAFVLLGGRIKDLGSRFWPKRKPGLHSRGQFVQALALSVAVTVFGIAYATTAASGSDPYGYVSQADLWIAGDLHVEQPWVDEAPWPSKYRSFAPLGYRPVVVDGSADGSLVPTYPPGLALLMAAAKAIAGQEVMFWIVPLAGGLLVLTTYAVGRRLAPPGAAIIATWLMAGCPAMLYMLVQPMSDVPVAAAWMAACYFLLHEGVRAGVAAGLAAALALLIRPNLAFLVMILAAWPLWRRTSGVVSGSDGNWSLRVETPVSTQRGNDSRGPFWQSAAFCAGASLGIIAVAMINRYLYGSALEFGHGDVSALFASSHFGPNLVRYSSWLLKSQTLMALAGMAAILVPWRRLWPDSKQRQFLVMPASVVVSVWLFYCFYLEFDAWWYLRFMLPVLPFIAIGTGAVVIALRRAGGHTISTLAAIALVLVVFTQYRFAVNHGVIDFWSGERRYVGVARLVRAQTDERSVIFSLQHSGSARYYGGRTTLRFDNLDRESLDEAVRWLSSRGLRSYLLVEEWEIAMFRERFNGQATLARLETPVAIYRGDRYAATLYDLSQAHAGGPQEIANPVEGLRSVGPAPLAEPLLSAQGQAHAENR